jgi:hypothetical protein
MRRGAIAKLAETLADVVLQSNGCVDITEHR